jgi:hypothetical protein
MMSQQQRSAAAGHVFSARGMKINIDPRQPIGRASSLLLGSAESEQTSRWVTVLSQPLMKREITWPFKESDQAEVVVAMMIGQEGRFGQDLGASSGVWGAVPS